MDIVWLLTAGLAGGFMNVMAGGGSLITLPVLLHMGFPAPLANGTNRVAILVQSLTAIAAFHARGRSEPRESLRMSAYVIPGALLGSLAGVRLTGRVFDLLLAAVMLGVAVLTVRQMRAPARQASARLSPGGAGWPGRLALVGIGFYGGFLQVGVGFLIMAALERIFRMDLITVNMHKVFLTLAFIGFSLPVFALQGQVNWVAGAYLSAGYAGGAWLSAHVQFTRGERWIRAVFLAALLLMAAKLVSG